MKTIPFFADLKKAMNTTIPRFRKSVPKSNEICLSDTWGITLPENASPRVVQAVKGLRAFMKASGVTIHERRMAVKNTISLICKASKKAESYSIDVTREVIRIEGDDSGIMYALFHLEDIMRVHGAPILPIGTISKSPSLQTRILRSPMAFFYADEFARQKIAYPDNYLNKIAHSGFNGIWLRGKLSDLAKVDVFPEFGVGSDEKIAELNDLVVRASRYGIRVYLYFNEPLAMPENSAFFDSYPHVKGQLHADEKAAALCTSTPEVKSFLRDGMRSIFSRIPLLGGVILITASEYHTHCYSHFTTRENQFETGVSTMQCPRCRERTPEDVIGEVITLIRDGVKAANPEAQVIAWNWSWSMYYDDPQSKIIAKVPHDVIIMADFERGSQRVTDGFEHLIDEYSLTFVGPADRFSRTAQEVMSSGREVYAKLQIGTTHEIASVPYFPLYRNLAEKLIRAKERGVSGAMECWNFGNILSPNTEVANAFSWDPIPSDIDEYLLTFAQREFGTTAAPGFCNAWRHFDSAAKHYPFSIPLLYWGPQNYGPAYPLVFEKNDAPTPVAWLLPAEIQYDMYHVLMERIDFGDDITCYLGPFTPEKLVSCLRNFCREWEKGLAVMKKTAKMVPPALKPNYIREYTVSAAVHSQLLTAAHVTEFISLRNAYLEETNVRASHTLLSRMSAIAREEIANARHCRTLAVKNPMLGFHGEAFGYQYTPKKIDAKITVTKATLTKIDALLKMPVA
ncbi:MAG: glycoside hydrolase family 20 zincin-like fold domain-containing protein [Spirochaetota bacterium]